MTEAAIIATALMALASFGATLLLAVRGVAGNADFGTALLRLAQALPLAVGFLYGIGAWWAGPVALLVGIGPGFLAAPFAGRAAVPLGVATLAAGLSYMGSIVFRGGLPT